MRFEFEGKDVTGIARSSRRIENSVEIIEKEIIRTVKVEDESRYTRLSRLPRLVVDDAISATREFITKARSEASGIAVLREVLDARMQTR
jgi:hypothetical protein